MSDDERMRHHWPIPRVFADGVLLAMMFFLLMWLPSVHADPAAQAEARADIARAKRGLSGKGTLVAIFDRGIDWRNADFRNADGTTRIAGIFDLSDDSGASAPNNPYGVGTIYTRDQINAALTGGPPLATRDAVGHGTASAGGCCGNGRNSGGKYIGIAPEATLLIIKFTSEGAIAHDGLPAEVAFNRPENLPKAIAYVKSTAAALGMPAVMFQNFGSTTGPADGSSVFARTIDANVGPGKPGLVNVTGTGDDGNSANHAMGSVAKGQSGTLLLNKGVSHATQPLYLELWYTGAAAFDVTLSGPAGVLGTFAAPGAATSDRRELPGVSYWHYGADGTPAGGLNPNGKRHIFMVFLSGSGNFSLELRNSGTASGDFHASLNPSRNVGGDNTTDSRFLSYVVPGYTIWDGATAFNNIAPTDYYGIPGYPGAVGSLWPGNSTGPTWDGRLGTTLSAPGEGFVVSCGAGSYWSTLYCGVADGKGLYTRFGAVSGANPIVAGAVALMLQANPFLDAAQVKSILQSTARRDSFTGPQPNTSWGYGKLDVAAAVDAAVLATAPGEVVVYEFYAPTLDHYFRTANADEANGLTANPNLGWRPTGGEFIAYARSSYPQGAQEVCRFYGSVTPGPNSHFYTADPGECSFLQRLQQTTPATSPRWNYEERAFAAVLPQASCPARSSVPVYRAYNNRAAQNDSNHRYTTSLDAYNKLIAAGWRGEGVVMCAIR